MIVNKKDLIFNIDAVVLLPKCVEEYVKTYEHNFKYVYVLDTTVASKNDFIKFIKTNNVLEVVLVDYMYEYKDIIDRISDIAKIDILFTTDLSSLSSDVMLDVHNKILELCADGRINKLGILDPNLYTLIKDKFEKTYLIKLDEPVLENNRLTQGVGLVNKCYEEKHSYFNELSAINMLDEIANVTDIDKVTKGFMKRFNINYKECESRLDVIRRSEVTLNINFADMANSYFLNSMDMGIPCIIGNNYILNGYKNLADKIQVKSDDDINEIAEKIKYVRDNKDEILKEYAIFREEYTKSAKESIRNFIQIREDEEDNSELLLTVGIPVYNVQDYVGTTIESVLKAIGKDTEILIVNDGSTDKSEEVVLKYVEKYPDLIRYIKQDNHGLGNVRNVIMKNARGKYIASIDSDDTININFFKEIEQYLREDIDICIYDWLSKPLDGNNFETPALDTNYTFESMYKKLLYATIMPSNCNKIVKKSIYQSIGLEFVEGLKFEDLGTNPITLNKVETIKYINKPYYEYYLRENSIMRTKVRYDMIDVLRILYDRLEKYADKNKYNKDEFLAYVFFWRIEESILNQLYNLEETERNDMIDYIYEKMNDILIAVYRDNKYVNAFIDRVDEETKNYIYERNENILNKNLKNYIKERMENNNYKILTPALILYNIDNR